MKLAFARTALFGWTKDTPRTSQAQHLGDALSDLTSTHSLIDAAVDFISARTSINSAPVLLVSSSRLVQVVLTQDSCKNASDIKYGLEIIYLESSSRDGSGRLVDTEKHEYTFWSGSRRYSYDYSCRAKEWLEMRCVCADRRYNYTKLLDEDVDIIARGLACVGIVLPI